MCEACEAVGQQAGITPMLAARARRLEGTLPGENVPNSDWEILLGHVGGAVPWVHMRRMLECLDLATRRAGAGLRCDAA